MTFPLGGHVIVQHCYHVPDLRNACIGWNALYGTGPFWTLDRLPPARVLNARGIECEMPVSIALAMAGDLCIELIQCEGPCELFDTLPHGGKPRFHHVAVFSNDYDADVTRLATAGHPLFCELFYAGGKRTAYMDIRGLCGHFLEIYEENPAIRGLFSMIGQVARDWDGADLIRPVPA